ncbi:PHP domain-containing protein [Fodinisporobacter ferrooxydans]|uniref:PHP domain-containing protein n=1 Tax=Fodinisporobacter ferrooxydans TaxID=2901836 RepID=A0ABY4CFX4_9BACL|nr:PHP domain-containing protein [Alicyclobacillaceae bacterium MYW30-H2]
MSTNESDLFDLHAHTTKSDGTYTPAELVRLAVEKGLAGIAVTDHDTLNGIEEARIAAVSAGIEIVPGVELNTVYNGREIHVLGYFIDETNESFLQLCKQLREGRVNRAEMIIERLQEAGCSITMEDVLAYAQGDAIGRPHIARVLVQKGYCSTLQEAFDRYLVPGKPGFVERMKLHPQKAVQAIREARGCPVLAHPGLIGDDALIYDLHRHGLGGIETEHPDHSPLQRQHYQTIAVQLQLIATGGSDFHGAGAEHRGDLGSVKVGRDVVARLFADAHKEWKPAND